MKEPRKKKKRVRTSEWREKPDEAFSHDLKRHRRTDLALHQPLAAPSIAPDFTSNATVLSHTKKWAFVEHDRQEVMCRIHECLIEQGATILAAGDEVLVQPGEEEPTVMGVAPRRSKLSRLAIEGSRVAEQIFAANIDILLIVAAVARPRFKLGLIDRYLIVADVGSIRPVLCLNKIDLVDKEPEVINSYRDLGVTVLNTSCKTGAGIDELRGILNDNVAVFAGHSGVGKSSLINALEPTLELATREVSESSEKGKHVTTGSRLYTLGDRIRIVDTPGIRQLGLWGVSHEEVAYYFPELAEHAEACRFRDCTHIHEPGCAVREAVEAGGIAPLRYNSYLRIRQSIQERKKY